MTKAVLIVLRLLVVGLSFGRQAHAFPELARHGYVNCTACHVSPSGGGVLTPYGRGISADLLSTWSQEGEADFLYSAVKSPKWLDLGGDVRSVEIYRNTPQVSDSRFLFMQGDLEAAATYKSFIADFSLGYYMSEIQTRRFFLGYRPIDEFSLRFGKFRQAYGLMDPNHTTAIHRGLGWDEGTETYNLETAWLGENWNAYLTLNFGPENSDRLLIQDKEKGAAFRLSVPFFDRYQAGISYFHGISELADRDVFGPFGILGFTKQFFLLTEFDFQATHGSSFPNTSGIVTWNKLDYEFIQGLHAYLTYELRRLSFDNSGAQSSAWGVGSQFFPRPHFEADLLWQVQSKPAFPGSDLDYVTLLLHFYI